MDWLFEGIFGSLLFGFAAWGLAIAALKKPRYCTLLVGGSFITCCISAMLQFFDLRRMVFHGALSTMQDTIDSSIRGVIIMMTVTIILDVLAIAWRNAVNQPEEAEEAEEENA